MNNYFINLDWQAIGKMALSVIALAMFILFKRPVSDSRKALKFGVGVFMVTILINVLGLTLISDYLSVLGFIIISVALLRLFWSDSSGLK